MKRLLYIGLIFFIHYAQGFSYVYKSLKVSKVHLREGPGKEYAVLETYFCKGLPVKILREYENWVYIEDYEKSRGWIHISMLVRKPFIMVLDAKSSLHQKPIENSAVIAYLEKGIIAKVCRIKENWAYVKLLGIPYQGWILKKHCFGLD